MSTSRENRCAVCPHHKDVFSKTIGCIIHACTKWDCVYEKGENDGEDSERYNNLNPEAEG